MTDRPILFSAPMVRALIAGTKTNTRRILKPGASRLMCRTCGVSEREFKAAACRCEPSGLDWTPCEIPRPRVGDRLWIREAWRTFVSLDKTKPGDLWTPNGGRGAGILYEADGAGLSLTEAGARYSGVRDDARPFGKLRPGIHMPRWASRLTLTVSEVKVERLQDISEADAIAEGIIRENVITEIVCYGGPTIERIADGYFGPHILGEHDGFDTAADAYFDLWDAIHGEGSADENPWIVATRFAVHHGNIDQMERT